LAHAKDTLARLAAEQNRMKTIFKLYRTLSAENKERMLAQLSAPEHETS
jgi:hypothetical protein